MAIKSTFYTLTDFICTYTTNVLTIPDTCNSIRPASMVSLFNRRFYWIDDVSCTILPSADSATITNNFTLTDSRPTVTNTATVSNHLQLLIADQLLRNTISILIIYITDTRNSN